jgi:uncharacterized membrane protein
MHRWPVLLAVIGLILATVLLQAGAEISQPSSGLMQEEYTTGVVLKVAENRPASRNRSSSNVLGFEEAQTIQWVKIRVDAGPLAGREFLTENVLGDNPAYNIRVARGDRIVLNVETGSDGTARVNIADRERMSVIGLLLGVLLLSLFLLGDRLLLKRLAILAVFLVLALKVLLPLLTQDTQPLPVFFLLAGTTLYLWEAVNGQSPGRCLSVTGLVILGLLLMLGIHATAMHIEGVNGFATESMASLWFMYPTMNFRVPLLLSLMISHMGALYWLVHRMADAPLNTAGCLSQGCVTLSPLLIIVLLMDLGLALPFLLPLRELPVVKLVNLEGTAAYLTLILSGAITLIAMVPIAHLWLTRKQKHQSE